MSSPNGAEWLDQTVRITPTSVFFGEHELPGLIAESGITLQAGKHDEFNRLTIEFIVGAVTADAAGVQSVEVGDVTLYSSKANQ